MSHHSTDQRYRVSGVNRNLLQKGGLVGGIALIALVLIFLSLPVKYFFVFNDGTLSLCVGRIGWLDGSKDKSFGPVYLGEEKDPELTSLLEMKFNTRDDALKALRTYALYRIHKHLAEIADLEQKMFRHYHVLLGEFLAAKQSGIENLDRDIEAIRSWLRMYEHRSSYHKEIKEASQQKAELVGGKSEKKVEEEHR